MRKYSPLLESPLLSENNVSTAELKAIPDIWRSSAERFGDLVALVDPHHDPPTNMTYKQVFFSYSNSDVAIWAGRGGWRMGQNMPILSMGQNGLIYFKKNVTSNVRVDYD